MSTKQFPYISSLTPFRFVAALGILLHHLSARYADFGQIMVPVRPFLASGVSFFFVLSGFVLAWKFKLERPRFVPYYLSRIIKLYPMAWLGLLFLIFGWTVLRAPSYFAAPSRDISDPIILAKFISHIFLLQAWWPKTSLVLGFNGPVWFLSVMIFLYASLPFIIQGERKLFYIILPVCLAIVFICITIQPYLLCPSDRAMPLVQFFPPVHLFEFALGVSTAYLAIKLSKKLPQLIKDINPTIISTLCLLIAMLPITRFKSTLNIFQSVGMSPAGLHYMFMCGTGVIYALLIAMIAAHQLATGRTSQFYGSMVPQLLGNSSLALFILHVPIIVVLRPPNWWSAMSIAIIIAIICHLTYETYVTRSLNKMMKSILKQ